MKLGVQYPLVEWIFRLTQFTWSSCFIAHCLSVCHIWHQSIPSFEWSTWKSCPNVYFDGEVLLCSQLKEKKVLHFDIHFKLIIYFSVLVSTLHSSRGSGTFLPFWDRIQRWNTRTVHHYTSSTSGIFLNGRCWVASGPWAVKYPPHVAGHWALRRWVGPEIE